MYGSEVQCHHTTGQAATVGLQEVGPAAHWSRTSCGSVNNEDWELTCMEEGRRLELSRHKAGDDEG